MLNCKPGMRTKIQEHLRSLHTNGRTPLTLSTGAREWATRATGLATLTMTLCSMLGLFPLYKATIAKFYWRFKPFWEQIIIHDVTSTTDWSGEIDLHYNFITSQRKHVRHSCPETVRLSVNLLVWAISHQISYRTHIELKQYVIFNTERRFRKMLSMIWSD